MSSYNLAGVSQLPFDAGAAILANRLVYVSGDEAVSPTTAITNVGIGAVALAASSGDKVAVQCFGVVKLTAQAAITAGAQVMPYAAGSTDADKGKIATAAGATAVSCGIALEAATNDGDVIAVLLIPTVNSPASS